MSTSLHKTITEILDYLKNNSRFYGEIIIKFQNGKPVLLCINKTIRVDEIRYTEIKNEAATEETACRS